jgi:hypothetical protein
VQGRGVFLLFQRNNGLAGNTKNERQLFLGDLFLEAELPYTVFDVFGGFGFGHNKKRIMNYEFRIMIQNSQTTLMKYYHG